MSFDQDRSYLQVLFIGCITDNLGCKTLDTYIRGPQISKPSREIRHPKTIWRCES